MPIEAPSNQIIFQQNAEQVLRQRTSVLRPHVTTTGMASGETYKFFIPGISTTMVERPGDGEIPISDRTDAEVSLSLVAKYARNAITDTAKFFASYDLQDESIKDLAALAEEEFDQTIITALDATTNTFTLRSGVANPDDMMQIRAQLSQNFVKARDEVCCLLTPMAFAQMQRHEDVTSVDYVNDKLLTSQVEAFRWGGVTYVMHPSLPGVGTSSAKCFMWSKMCVGHAAPSELISLVVDAESEKTNFRTLIGVRLFHAAKIIQAGGVFEFTHDDTISIGN